ncbi:MAG: hypothetical protein FD172_2850 [Methylocystaceae bacterium]|nr:MAG: hypothetical protein FD172_2850 [Methylocystaceae bacterium]
MNDTSEIDMSATRAEVARLRLEVGVSDQLQIQRLKKRKLLLRDRIAYLEDQLTPDIIA